MIEVSSPTADTTRVRQKLLIKPDVRRRFQPDILFTEDVLHEVLTALAHAHAEHCETLASPLESREGSSWLSFKPAFVFDILGPAGVCLAYSIFCFVICSSRVVYLLDVS